MESGGYGLAAGRADPAEDGPAGGVERRLSRKRHRVQLSHTRLRASPAGALLRRGTRKPQRGRRIAECPTGHQRGARGAPIWATRTGYEPHLRARPVIVLFCDLVGLYRGFGARRPGGCRGATDALPRFRSRRSGTRRPRSWSRRSPAGSREEIERAILEPTDATELYAEELVRLAAERGVDAGFPGSVQALIAAGLHTLSHKELVRPTCTGSREGVAEYVFWHALAPDVACPRADPPTRRRSSEPKASRGELPGCEQKCSTAASKPLDQGISTGYTQSGGKGADLDAG
jgi:hypothetical protein